jgi:adenylate cyclase
VFIPLRLKLALLTSVLLVAGIGTVSFIVLERSRGALEAEAQKRAMSIARNLARNARVPVLEQDDVVLASLLAAVSQEGEVIVARILDRDGHRIAASRDGENPAQVRLTQERRQAAVRDGNELVAAARLSFRDVDLGEAQLVIDLDALISPVVTRAQRDILLASGGLLIVGLVLAFATSARVTRPLQRLRIATQALAAGDLSARVEPRTRDEVGDLTRAFNAMGQSLTQKRRVETAFRRYVSDHVLRQVLDQPDAVSVEGEMREVTLLFVDVRRFTSLSEGLRPEGVVRFLNDAFELITSRLLDHGGTVDKYAGDAVMAYFGAPIQTVDHAERAVAAAISIQRSVRERNEKLEARADRGIHLGVGISIHTGSVVVGNIGSERKMDYTVIGDAVNVTSRLEKLAEEGSILITRRVAERVGRLVTLEGRGVQHLEGREQPVTIYEVLY